MSATTSVLETLEIILDQVRDLDRQAAEKKRTANDLCRVLRRPAIFEDIDVMASGLTTRPDEYYGRQAPEVIRAILEKRKQGNLGAASVGEIYDAMLAGGYSFQTENGAHAKRGIYSILASDPMFHRLPGGRVGLTAWYPAIKSKDEAKSKPHRKGSKARQSKRARRATKARRVRKPTGVNAPTHEEDEPAIGTYEPENGSTFARGDLLRQVNGIIQELPISFNTVDVVRALERKTGAEVKRSSVKAVLDRLEEKGHVEIVFRGSGRRPSSYRKVEKTKRKEPQEGGG